MRIRRLKAAQSARNAHRLQPLERREETTLTWGWWSKKTTLQPQRKKKIWQSAPKMLMQLRIRSVKSRLVARRWYTRDSRRQASLLNSKLTRGTRLSWAWKITSTSPGKPLNRDRLPLMGRRVLRSESDYETWSLSKKPVCMRAFARNWTLASNSVVMKIISSFSK